MATIDEELRALERDIRTLKIEYDQFFGGGRKRPPSEIEWRIELVIKKYGERGGEMKFNQRFRFTNLSQTYAKKQAGEETSRLSRENFKEFVKKKTRDLQKQKNCRDVEYVVEVVGGQVKLKALVKA